MNACHERTFSSNGLLYLLTEGMSANNVPVPIISADKEENIVELFTVV